MFGKFTLIPLLFISMYLLRSPVCGNVKDNLARNTTLLLDQLLLSYDKRLRPEFGGRPTLVDVNLNIRSMGPVSEQNMAYQMDCYFRQSWVDKRLRFRAPFETLGVSVNMVDRIWKPDTYFINGRKSYLHTVTSPNKLLRINRDGRILYSMRITIKANCPMYLENFPMDTQTCPLKLGSHSYNVRDVQYVWTQGPQNSIKMASDMTLSQFDLIGFPAGNQTFSKMKEPEHSLLFAKFVLRRHMGYFLINIYVPCSLLVVLSWVAFWINREATADRISLGVMTVLTMAFLTIDNRRDLPKVSYSTALDHFVGVCFTFVLATILQFAGVHYFTKHGSGEVSFYPEPSSDNEDDTNWQDVSKNCNFQDGTCSVNTSRSTGESCDDKAFAFLEHTENSETKTNFCLQFWNCLLGSSSYKRIRASLSPESVNSVSQIDKAARIVFPLVFAAYNLVYWFRYLY